MFYTCKLLGTSCLDKVGNYLKGPPIYRLARELRLGLETKR